jgi:hypothetical protein
MTKGADGLRVLNVFGQMERGGAELRAVELAEAFRPDQVRSDFLVLSGLDGVLDDRVRAAGGDVVKCALSPSFMWKFYRLLRQRRYDVVHSHVHYFSGVILSLARIAGIRGRVSHLHTARVNDRETAPATNPACGLPRARSLERHRHHRRRRRHDRGMGRRLAR